MPTPHPRLAHVDEYGPDGRRSARDKRRFGALITAVVGAIVIAGGFAVSLLTHISIQWAPLLWAAVIVVIGYGAFLWVRLTH